MRKLTLLIVASFSFVVLASQVLRVGATQQVCAVSALMQGAWSVGDRACISHKASLSACGNIVSITAEYSVLKLDRVVGWVGPGQAVKKVGSAPPPIQAPSLMDEQTDRPKRRTVRTQYDDMTLHDFSLGVAVGLTFLYPVLHFQRLLNESLAIGLMPLYFRSTSSTGTLSGIGGFVTSHWYVDEFFRGIWLQLGGGLVSLSNTTTSTSEHSLSIALLGTGGWRHVWKNGLNVGVAGGMQFIKEPEFLNVKLSAANIQPLILIDVGYSF